MSHSSGRMLEVQDQGASVVGFLKRSSSELQTAKFLLCPHVAEGPDRLLLNFPSPPYYA